MLTVKIVLAYVVVYSTITAFVQLLGAHDNKQKRKRIEAHNRHIEEVKKHPADDRIHYRKAL